MQKHYLVNSKPIETILPNEKKFLYRSLSSHIVTGQSVNELHEAANMQIRSNRASEPIPREMRVDWIDKYQEINSDLRVDELGDSVVDEVKFGNGVVLMPQRSLVSL
jgi:hypothetical protein